jgi:hypothetical protein
MDPELFKGDAVELKMKGVGDPLFDLTDLALNDFYANGFQSSQFLLMLYDEGRMPFSNRIDRDAFVDFFTQMLDLFPFTGTFDTYIFVLTALFGSEVQIVFDVPDPGKLSIDILAISAVEYEFIARELVGSEYEFHNVIDDVGNFLVFRSLPGISDEYSLNLLFSEIIPAGISPEISLNFYSIYSFVAEESSTFYDMVTSIGDQIIFFEIGG